MILALNVTVVFGLLLAAVCVFVAGWFCHREHELYRRARGSVGRHGYITDGSRGRR